MSNYHFSFTSSAAAIEASVSLATLYITVGDWDTVRETTRKANIFQARTLSSSDRQFREIAGRLKTLNAKELALLATGAASEQGQLSWLAICQRYKPIHDFAIEKLAESFHQSLVYLAEDSFDSFYHQKAQHYPELEALAPATISKARRVVFRMLKECGLLSSDNMIIPQAFSPNLLMAMGDSSLQKARLFPGV